MNLFKCSLISKNGFVRAVFYRNGESAKEVLSNLELFKWAEGKWNIDEISE